MRLLSRLNAGKRDLEARPMLMLRARRESRIDLKNFLTGETGRYQPFGT